MAQSGPGTALLAVVLLHAALTAHAQQFFFGACPSQQVVQNFDSSRYLGTWFEIENYFAIFEVGAKCVKATYSDKGSGKIGVVNSQINVLTNKPNSISGEAELVRPSSGEAKLQVSFFQSPFGNLGASSEGNYWVLDTDYDSYSIVWSCQDIKLANFQILWILTREQQPSGALISQAKDIIRQRGLDLTKLERTDQTNCP